jgi:AcrR family transcriptional regulator
MVKRGVSKEEWLEAGLEAIGKGGVSDLTVKGLAKKLGIAKAGFYWHFKNRDDMLRQLLNYWTHQLTEVVTSNVELLKLGPRERLIQTAQMILDYDLSKYDLAVREWALQNPEAARVVRKVNRFRLDFVRQALSELDFDDKEQEIRAMLFVCYHTWESSMFCDISRKRRREQIARRIEILTHK